MTPTTTTQRSTTQRSTTRRSSARRVRTAAALGTTLLVTTLTTTPASAMPPHDLPPGALTNLVATAVTPAVSGGAAVTPTAVTVPCFIGHATWDAAFAGPAPVCRLAS